MRECKHVKVALWEGMYSTYLRLHRDPARLLVLQSPGTAVQPRLCTFAERKMTSSAAAATIHLDKESISPGEREDR